MGYAAAVWMRDATARCKPMWKEYNLPTLLLSPLRMDLGGLWMSGKERGRDSLKKLAIGFVMTTEPVVTME